MFGGLGMWELILIFFIVLLFFGAKRLPEIGGSLGKGIREFKEGVKEMEGAASGEITSGEEETSSSQKDSKVEVES